ncbi:MAG: ClpXP protease specificity-enhancing factor SspB [Polyangia bacterium]
MTTEKRQILLELLKDAWVYVHLDPRRDGVALPDFLRQEPRVVLQYGYNMPVPIADLTIDEEGIKATLSFRRTPWSTVIPWHAVFALSDGEERHFVWEADVPADLDRPGAQAPGQPNGQSTGQPGAGGPSELTGRSTSQSTGQSTGQSTATGPSVSSPQAKPGTGTGPAAKPGKKPRPSHLKLVD